MEYVVGFLIATAVGLTGVGAGSITAPILILFFHFKPAIAVGTALTFAAVIKLSVLPIYLRRQQVNFRILLLLCSGGIPGVIISYQTFLKDGTLVASVSSATVLLGSLIPGLKDAMQGMRPGGERLIVVPSAMAYGNAATRTGIPPNSTLVFDLLFKAYPLQ